VSGVCATTSAPAFSSSAALWYPQATPMGRTPAASAMAMSKLVSPIITACSPCAIVSSSAASSMAGCGLEGWRSAVCSEAK
jgi:hypothetical protein